MFRSFPLNRHAVDIAQMHTRKHTDGAKCTFHFKSLCFPVGLHHLSTKANMVSDQVAQALERA